MSKVTLPHLTLSWNKNPEAEVSVVDGVFPEGDGLVIGLSGYRPLPKIRVNSRRSAAVVGAPVLDEKVSSERVAQEALVATDLERFARSLNGQFLIFVLDKEEKRLVIINDRFNGVPFYWADSADCFRAAYLYYDLFKVIRRQRGIDLRQDVMLQFLWLNRVLMDATYDTASHFMLPATVLTVDENGINQKRYWRPDFSKKIYRSTRDAGAEYVEHLRRSLARLTSDERPRKYGHFLSGGHDSRSILGAFPQPPACLTVSFSDNLEVECARESAAVVGAPHHFIKLDGDHMVQNFDDAVRLCGGMHSFLDALFIGLEDRVQPFADVVFHGHGLDYLFQGMYLPSRWVALFGRPTFFRRMMPLAENLIDHYLNNIPFRVKGVDIPALMLPGCRQQALDGLRAAVGQVIEDGSDICRSNNDHWEYLIIHALGRHYSHPNIDSKLTCAEQRTPCFDNDLFNFYLSLPAEHRVHGEVMRYALNTMNPALGRIPTGNWGIPAGASPAVKTAWLIARKLLRHLTGNERYKAPTVEDRTWPDREQYLRGYPSFVAEVRDALDGDQLAEILTVFDWQALRQQGNRWLNGESGGAAFLMALVTLNRFLRLTR